VLLVAACARPAPPPVLASRSAAQPCDEASWHRRATSPLRARIGDRDVIVDGECYGLSHVIAKLPAALVGRTVPDRQLARVVEHATPLWTSPGGDPLPGVVVAPGVAVHGTGAWLEVHEAMAIDVTGYVPAAATGRVWEAAPPPGTNGRKLGRFADVLAEPRPGADRVAAIPANEPVLDRVEAGSAGWLNVTASDASVRVTGWIEPAPPPPPPSPLAHTYDFSDDVIEGDLVEPEGEDVDRVHVAHAAPGCLRATPDDGGEVLGVVTAPVAATPVGDGWLRLVLAAPWGEVVGYVREPR